MSDGTRLAAGPLQAPGEPEDPRLEELIASKVARLIDQQRDARPATASHTGLRGYGGLELIDLLCNPIAEWAHA